jgi:uncharacterized membrane protein
MAFGESRPIEIRKQKTRNSVPEDRESPPGINLFAAHLPSGSAVIAFWLLASGTALGWQAALFGAADLIALSAYSDSPRFKSGLTHGGLNGGVTIGFSAIWLAEYSRYPDIHHSVTFLAVEIALLVVMAVGNWFGGAARGAALQSSS